MLFVDLTGQATGCPIYCGHLGLIGLVVVAVVFNVGWAATPIFAIWAIIRGGVARRVGIAALVAGLVPVVLLLVGLSTA
jgi:hypothetical protein